MSKKDYNNFARLIRSERHKIANARAEVNKDSPTGTIPFNNGCEKMLNIIIDDLIILLQQDDPRFDAEKFIKACEIDTLSKEKE